jgi:hypothetical protein
MGPDEPTGLNQDRFGEVLAAYLEAVDAGWAPARRNFAERYPQYRGELESFFASQDEVHALAEPFRTLSGAGDTPAPSGEPPTVILDGPGSALPRTFGDYELEEEIARGGMGVVFKARQVGLDRTVALKMILAGRLATAEEVRRFRNEAEAAALLSHPNIVPIYEVGERDGQPFFSMKLIEGGNLAQHAQDFLARPREAARFLVPVARAVHYAHQRGILHRDLKPANILLQMGNEEKGVGESESARPSASSPIPNPQSPIPIPLVTDFGLAKRFHDEADLTQSSAILGTPCYMAPEQAQGKGGGLTTASDVYSLGAILYELLTGRPPFKAENPLETLLQVRQKPPVPPRALNPRVDRDLETICLKCLEKQPGRRYSSAEALADDLERYLGHDLIAARRAGAWERAWKWARRQPARAVVSVLVGVIAVLCLVGAGMLVSLNETQRALEMEAERASAEEAARKEAEAARADAEKARAQSEAAQKEAEAEKKRAQEALYAYRLAQTRLALFARKPGEALRQLESCPSEQRAWEWHHLKQLCETDALPVDTPGARVMAMAHSLYERVSAPRSPRPMAVRAAATPWGYLTFSPDGNNLAAAYGGEPAVLLWDVASGKPARGAPQPGGPVQCVAYTADGRFMWTAGAGAVKSWEANSGRPVGELRAVQNFQRAALSHDARRLATVGPGPTLQVRDRPKGRVLRLPLGKVKGVRGLVFSPSGRRLAAVCDEKAIRVWDVDAGKVLADLPGHAKAVRGLAFSCDGARLASASDDTTVKVWDLKTGNVALTLRGHTRPVHGVAFSPDGMRLASASADRTVRVWDARTGMEVLPLAGHTSAVLNVAFSPDGKRLASLAEDRKVKVWDAALAGRGRPKDKK